MISQITIGGGGRISSNIVRPGPSTLTSHRSSVNSAGLRMSMVENLHTLVHLTKFLWERFGVLTWIFLEQGSNHCYRNMWWSQGHF